MTEEYAIRVSLPFGNWFLPNVQKEIERILNMSPERLWHKRDENSADMQKRYDMGDRQINYSNAHDCVVSLSGAMELLRYMDNLIVRSITRLSDNLSGFQPRTNVVMNERVQVVVPGPALQEYDKVLVLENCCTDRLREELDSGWRILAICVQPDQRRPDYILGKRGDIDG